MPLHATLLAALADSPLAVVLVVAAWCTVGLVGASVMTRRGHSRGPIRVLGLVLGPLFIGYAVTNLRWREQAATPLVLREGRELEGTDRVLIAMLGGPTSVADVLPLLRSSGDRIGRVSIACAVSFEAVEAPEAEETPEDPA